MAVKVLTSVVRINGCSYESETFLAVREHLILRTKTCVFGRYFQVDHYPSSTINK